MSGAGNIKVKKIHYYLIIIIIIKIEGTFSHTLLCALALKTSLAVPTKDAGVVTQVSSQMANPKMLWT